MKGATNHSIHSTFIPQRKQINFIQSFHFNWFYFLFFIPLNSWNGREEWKYIITVIGRSKHTLFFTNTSRHINKLTVLYSISKSTQSTVKIFLHFQIKRSAHHITLLWAVVCSFGLLVMGGCKPQATSQERRRAQPITHNQIK